MGFMDSLEKKKYPRRFIGGSKYFQLEIMLIRRENFTPDKSKLCWSELVTHTGTALVKYTSLVRV